MRSVVVFFFYFSIIYSQEMEVIHPLTQQVTMVRHGSMNLPKNTALQTIDDCDKRINENPQDWQAYYSRARSKQILNDFNSIYFQKSENLIGQIGGRKTRRRLRNKSRKTKRRRKNRKRKTKRRRKRKSRKR